MRLLEKGGMAAMTTNAVAATAGVSIGTLYQYFPNKAAILDALADREMASVTARVMETLRDPADLPPRERIGRIVRAVAGAYGERRGVHALVIEHSLMRDARRLQPMLTRIMALLTSPDRPADGTRVTPFSAAEAFVLTNAFVGVMRATIMREDADSPPQSAIEDALARMMTGFLDAEAAFD